MDITIAIDCMGGDHGPSVTLPAAIEFLRADSSSKLLLIGLPEIFTESEMKRLEPFSDRVTVRHASEVVAMDESPTSALRMKKDSSMRVAMEVVKSGEAQAAISAGNTGALVAISRFVLKMLPGIDRPAIATTIPTQKGLTCMLDFGANVDCSADHLLQFGLMGAMLVEAVEHRTRPTVGLLNIGEEEIKGNEAVKQASELLRNSGLNFYGNVEGDDIYKGTTDVVVCDGFVGNTVLKASEGIAKMMMTSLRQEFSRSWMTKLSALIAKPVLVRFKSRLDPRLYNGASLLGLRGIVVKSHGSADVLGYTSALHRTAEAARNDLIGRIEHRMGEYLAQHKRVVESE